MHFTETWGTNSNGRQHHRSLPSLGAYTENYHGSNTVFLVGILLSIVGFVFVTFTLMALCYRSMVVNENLWMCLRLVTIRKLFDERKVHFAKQRVPQVRVSVQRENAPSRWINSVRKSPSFPLAKNHISISKIKIAIARLLEPLSALLLGRGNSHYSIPSPSI